MKCSLSTSPTTDQSTGKNHWTSLTPATPSIIYPCPYIFPFVPLSPALNSTAPASSFLPSSSLSIHLSPFSNLFSSPQGPYHTQRLHFPCSRSLPPCRWTFPHSQPVCNPGSNPPSQLKGHLVDLNFTVSFYFPLLVSTPATPPVNTIQPTVWLYLGSSNSFNAFLKDLLNFTPSFSELTPCPLNSSFSATDLRVLLLGEKFHLHKTTWRACFLLQARQLLCKFKTPFWHFRNAQPPANMAKKHHLFLPTTFQLAAPLDTPLFD